MQKNRYYVFSAFFSAPFKFVCFFFYVRRYIRHRHIYIQTYYIQKRITTFALKLKVKHALSECPEKIWVVIWRINTRLINDENMNRRSDVNNNPPTIMWCFFFLSNCFYYFPHSAFELKIPNFVYLLRKTSRDCK